MLIYTLKEAKLNAILAEIEDAKSQIDEYEENIAKIDPVASGTFLFGSFS